MIQPSEEQRRQLLGMLPNPFDTNRIDSAWAAGFVDVPSIHEHAFNSTLRALQAVRSTQASRGILILGERGSGKTHLLHRVRSRILSSPDGFFAYIQPATTPDRIFRNFLSHIARDFLKRDEFGLTQLDLAVASLLRKRAGVRRQDSKDFWISLREKYPPKLPLFEYLEEPLDEVAADLVLDGNVVRVIRHLVAKHHPVEASAWIQGQPIAEEQLQKLGVRDGIEDEDAALAVIRGLLSLSPPSCVDVLAFDQIEALQKDDSDVKGLRAFGNAIARLISEIPSILVISCIQVSFSRALRGAINQSLFDRIAQDQDSIRDLGYTEARELIRSRVERHEEIATAASLFPERDAYWPMDEQEVKEFVLGGGRAARDIIDAARMRFEARVGRGSVLKKPVVTISGLWDQELEAELSRATVIPDRGFLADAFLKLVPSVPVFAKEKATDAEHKDIDVRLQKGSRKTGVCFCNEGNLTSLAARLNRLLKDHPKASPERLIVVRDERAVITKQASKVRERMEALKEAGHSFVHLGPAGLSAITAAKKLLDSAASGDFPFSPKDLREWLMESCPHELDDALKPLVLGPEVPRVPIDDSMERLIAFLQSEYIAPLAEAVQQSGLSPSALEERLSLPHSPAILITGSPSVVLLKPEVLVKE